VRSRNYLDVDGYDMACLWRAGYGGRSDAGLLCGGLIAVRGWWASVLYTDNNVVMERVGVSLGVRRRRRRRMPRLSTS
jgi:hypothetical protein